MSRKIFPIKTETACKLKWSWNTLRLYTGGSSSCHRVAPDVVSIDSFANFHNTQKKLDDRQLMLDGKWPSGGCEYCQQVEDAGGLSDRMFHLRIPDQYPKELDGDSSLKTVSPTIMEVYLDNVCNLSCLYCWDGFSSKIQQENSKHGVFDSDGVVIQNKAVKHPQFHELKDKFWEWMWVNSGTLSRLHILGGEPFYQKDFETCLSFLESKKHPDLEFNVVSNLMIDHESFKSKISRIRALVTTGAVKRFDLTASVDCFGEGQEYVRYGLNLDVWKLNFEFLVNQPWVYLNINQTLSSLTIKGIPELIDYINQFNDSREIGHYMSTTVMTYDFLHPKIFGSAFYSDEFSSIIEKMKENTWQQREAKKYINGIVSYLSTQQRDQEQIDKLIVYLNEIDRRRGLNWRQTFPWLIKEVSDVLQ